MVTANYKLHYSFSEPNIAGKVKKAVTTLGRQLTGETFVFGPTVQIASNGDLIPLECQQYEWVEQVVKLASVIPDSPLLEIIPKCDEPLDELLNGLRILTQENFGSAVFVLGAYRSCESNHFTYWHADVNWYYAMQLLLCRKSRF